MKKNTIFNILVEMKRRFIENLKPTDMKKHNGKSFTRKRSLSLNRLFTIMLRCSPYSLQIRLDDFFKELGLKEEVVSKQALSKARTNLDPDILKQSFIMTAKALSECEVLELYKDKFRICAFDRSDVALDNATDLLTHFGGSGAKKDCAMA